ncbi:DNA-binding response regulator [Arthrobacter koreensis]|uniref:DNA-binding response regulator n=1 Tax=Arthrobacter koreensis TaxID=199136 RepID=UPI0036DCC97A
MLHGETTPGLDAGTKAEVRVAQAWFWDGYYVRRGVDLQHRFSNEATTVTDLDVLGVTLDAALKGHKHIGEVKTGKSGNTPRPLDRALWLHGVRELIGAESAEITTAFKTSSSIRDVCNRLGVSVQHLDDLKQRENRLAITEVNDLGSHGESVAKLRKDVLSYVKTDAALERGYWFLTSEVWFLDPFDALKRTLGLIRELSKIWPEESQHRALRVARWFFAEAVSIVGLNLAIVAGHANTMDESSFRDIVGAKLSSGDIPSYAVRKLSERFDEYLGKILSSLDAPADIRVTAVGAFLPTEPEYAEPLVELIHRLSAEAATTAKLPRQLDAIMFERLVRRRDLDPQVLKRLCIDRDTERQVRLIAAFLRGQFSLPAPVEKVLTSPMRTENSRRGSAEQTALFDEPKAGTGDSA